MLWVNMKLILQVDTATLALPREYLSKGFANKYVKAYFQYAVDIAVMLGADETRAKQELKEVFELEMILANVCTAVKVLLNTEIKIFVHEDNCLIIIL